MSGAVADSRFLASTAKHWSGRAQRRPSVGSSGFGSVFLPSQCLTKSWPDPIVLGLNEWGSGLVGDISISLDLYRGVPRA